MLARSHTWHKAPGQAGTAEAVTAALAAKDTPAVTAATAVTTARRTNAVKLSRLRWRGWTAAVASRPKQADFLSVLYL